MIICLLTQNQIDPLGFDFGKVDGFFLSVWKCDNGLICLTSLWQQREITHTQSQIRKLGYCIFLAIYNLSFHGQSLSILSYSFESHFLFQTGKEIASFRKKLYISFPNSILQRKVADQTAFAFQFDDQSPFFQQLFIFGRKRD